MRVVATAGHVDHGKSSLVLALTGTDPDRFPEEKTRGLTIDLGFAFCTLPSGRVVGFVDVPGHIRFIKNMLAGVGAVDVALLVVAANEGWMPQTEEHVQILQLLDIEHGLIAITKADLVDDDTLELVRLEVAERVAWPTVVVDSLSGRGLDDVREALDAVLESAPSARDRARPRLWIDRVFAAKGSGTVVTGTLTGGALGVGDEVLVEPGARSARIRRVESQHAQLDAALPGSRVALNLVGVDHSEVARGDVVVRADQWKVVSAVDVALRAVPGHRFARRSMLDAHIGSGEQRARVRLLDEGGFARVTLARPLPLAPGDRIVLRSSGARATIGGAEVLDIEPARRTADAVARLALPLEARVFAARPWCTPEEFARLSGVSAPASPDVVQVGAWYVTEGELARVRARAAEVARDGWPAITTVAAACGVEVAQLRAALGDELADSPLDDPAARKFLDALATSPFAPPTPAEVGTDPALVRALVRAGALVDLDGLLFGADAVEAAHVLVTHALRERGDLTVSELREVLNTSRKFALPLLNRLDSEGVTRRNGDRRTLGPRARAER
jgi:selenocysteine-specific elongation factor